MNFDSCLKTEKTVKTLYLEAGEQQQYDQHGLQPVPETLVACIKVYIFHIIVIGHQTHSPFCRF
jgi:hypothetical protein